MAAKSGGRPDCMWTKLSTTGSPDKVAGPGSAVGAGVDPVIIISCYIRIIIDVMQYTQLSH